MAIMQKNQAVGSSYAPKNPRYFLLVVPPVEIRDAAYLRGDKLGSCCCHRSRIHVLST